MYDPPDKYMNNDGTSTDLWNQFMNEDKMFFKWEACKECGGNIWWTIATFDDGTSILECKHCHHKERVSSEKKEESDAN